MVSAVTFMIVDMKREFVCFGFLFMLQSCLCKTAYKACSEMTYITESDRLLNVLPRYATPNLLLI